MEVASGRELRYTYMCTKVGIVCFPTYGGSGVIATELGKHLLEKGYEVHFISSSLPSRLTSFRSGLYYHEVVTYEYPLFDHPYYALSLASKIVDIARSHGLDLLHVHYAIPHATAAYLAREILCAEGVYLPIITTLHGTDITLVGKDASFAPVASFSINVSNAVTAVSRSLQKETLRHFNLQVPIEVIYNFVDVAHFGTYRPEAKAQLCKEDEYLLLHVSNLRKVKRAEDVVQVFYKVQQQLPAFLVVVGDGPERGCMEESCRRLGLEGKVRFFGKTGAIEDILCMADLLLVPSEKESFGLAALEAMAAKTPVVASDVGGLPELIQNGKSGFVCPVGDIDAMAERALYVLSPNRLTEFKERAMARAKDFDTARIVPQYEALYQRVLDTKQAAIAQLGKKYCCK